MKMGEAIAALAHYATLTLTTWRSSKSFALPTLPNQNDGRAGECKDKQDFCCGHRVTLRRDIGVISDCGHVALRIPGSSSVLDRDQIMADLFRFEGRHIDVHQCLHCLRVQLVLLATASQTMFCRWLGPGFGWSRALFRLHFFLTNELGEPNRVRPHVTHATHTTAEKCTQGTGQVRPT